LDEKFFDYLLLGFLELSLDNNPKIAIVIKKKAVA
jgi:hypothetical protein